MTMIYPELALILLPAVFLWYRYGRATGMTAGLRLLLLILIVLCLTEPAMNLAGTGIDLVVVADRSRSMPAGSDSRLKELLRALQKSRRPDDRIALIGFGAQTATEQPLSHDPLNPEFSKKILPDGSDLNDALQHALDLLRDTHRAGRILILSDGESNGASPLLAARRARNMNVPIDFRNFERLRTSDVAVEALLLPDLVGPREPFSCSAWLVADEAVESQVVIKRDGHVISEVNKHLHAGRNQVMFRDLLEPGGLHKYEVTVKSSSDSVAENNHGEGIVRVQAGPRLLVINDDGQPDNFTRALESGQIPFDVTTAKGAPLTLESLDRYGAVAIENVPAAAFGRIKLQQISRYVKELGGGFLLTGGERSFGTGGYFKSDVDEILPVSMEMRNEHRKGRLALAIALDRSGSMAIPVKGGKVKMDLANRGTVECLHLLSPGDSVAIIAVDSQAHIIQPMAPLTDVELATQRALSIRSQGGGIFVYEALVAAGNQLIKAEQATKHIILFSDANDSEEPGDYKNLLAKYERAGITVSVIGLGAPTDSDAALLKDIASLGHGQILFTDDAQELPRLFAEDTLKVARSTFIQKDPDTQPTGIPGKLLPTSRLLGEFGKSRFPNVDGYNLSYLKPKATLGVQSLDEYSAPWAAFWYHELGRVAAMTIEVDGSSSGAFGQWDEYADFIITYARWLLGPAENDDVYVSMSQEGQDVVVNLELDPDRPSRSLVTAPSLLIATPEEDQIPVELPFQWNGPHSLQARFKLTQMGTYLSRIKLSDQNSVRGPAATLPYSIEFAPRFGQETGQQVMRQIAEVSSGKERVQMADVFTERHRNVSRRPLTPYLLIIAATALILEIAGRRLSLWPDVSQLFAKLLRRKWIPASLFPPKDSSPAPSPVPANGAAVSSASAPAETQPPPTEPSKPPGATPSSAPSTADVFAQAKAGAKRRY